MRWSGRRLPLKPIRWTKCPPQMWCVFPCRLFHGADRLTPATTFDFDISPRRPRPARYRYFPGSGGPGPPAGGGGRLSGPPLPVPLPPFAFLTLLLEVLAGASAGPGCAVPCATLMFELEVVCAAFCACVTIASAKRLAHITDPRIGNDIVGGSFLELPINYCTEPQRCSI
jgi:hypothetical protein